MNSGNKIILPHDLSAGVTRLSFELLIKTANIAVGMAKNACSEDIGALQTASFASNFTGMKYASRNLAQHAEALQVAADTLFVLMESKSRPEIEIIGKPEVQEN